MNSEEYERRRRTLEAQLQADLDLIRTGHQAKLRALEQLWLGSPEEDGTQSLAEVPREAPANETVRSETASNETAPSETPDLPPGRVHRRGDTLNDLRAALPRLPEVFEKKDVYHTLGYTPARATLYRARWTLKRENLIAIARYSDGGVRAQYRKLPEP